MAVAKPTRGEEKTPPHLILPDVVQETAVVDTFKDNYNTLATFVSGSRCTVDYYKRISGRDDAPASQQDSLAAVWGSYLVIEGLEIRITDFLSHHQTQDHNRGWRSNFSAVVVGVVTPEEGDFMVMDMGNGQPVIATVIQPTDRGSPYTESSTKFECKITDVYSPEKKAIIDRKIVERKVFSMELLRQGLKPLLSHEEVGLHRQLKKAYLRMAALYMRDFYNRDFHTLVLPMQAGLTYDPFVTKFVKATFESDLHPLISQIQTLGVEHSFRGQEMTLFDALETMDEDLIPSLAQRAGIVPGSDYYAKPAYRTIYYSGIHRIVAMKDSPFSVNYPSTGFAGIDDIERAGVRQKQASRILPAVMPGDAEPRPADPHVAFIKRVAVDDYYVFSEAFYKEEPGQSQLEVMTRQMMTRKAIDLKELVKIAEFSDEFNNLERFYYVPVLMTIIRMAIGAVK